VDRSIPPELETIILKAVSKNPADRYATAQAFADDLNRFIDNKPIQARRPTLVQRGRKWAQRHPAVIIASVLFCFLTAVGALVGVALLENEQSNTKAALMKAQEQEAEAIKQEALARDQEREAKEQKARAQEHLRIAREAIAEMINIAESDLTYPGMEAARNRSLEATLKYFQQLIDQYRDDPAAQDELAAAQAHVKTILEDLAVMQVAGQFHLLKITEVLDDMGVEPERRERIDRLNAQLGKQRDEAWKSRSFSSPEARQQWFLKQAEIAVAQDKGFTDILTASQFARLKQINLQSKGLFAFHDPKIVHDLKLSEDQQAKIRDIEGNGFGPFGGRPRDGAPGRGGRGPGSWGGFGGGRPPGDRGGFPGREGRGGRGDPPGKGSKEPGGMTRDDFEKQQKEALDKLKKEAADKLRKVQALFNAEQTATWKAMSGEPFKGDLWNIQANPFGGGFGRGGFGGFGGPGGGPGGPGGPPPGQEE
jgi:hypothetical protein